LLLRKSDLKNLYGPLCNRPYFEDDYTEKYLWSIGVDQLLEIANERGIEANDGELKKVIIGKILESILNEESTFIEERENE